MMMVTLTTKLYLDDVRDPPDDSWNVVKSSQDAKAFVAKTKCIPDVISFDHDLGGDDTAMVFIHWLIDQVLDGNYQIPKGFEFRVHSANPVGRDNIGTLMKNFLEFVKE